MSKLSVFPYQSPVRQSSRLLDSLEKSPIEINRLENLLEKETEFTIIDIPGKDPIVKSLSRKRSIVCVLKDGTKIRLCSTCANKNKDAMGTIEKETIKRTTRKKTTGDSKTKSSVVTRSTKKISEDTIQMVTNNNTVKDTSTKVTKSKRIKKNQDDQTLTGASENEKDIKKRTTRKRKEKVDSTEDGTEMISKQEKKTIKSSRAKTRKATVNKDTVAQNESSDKNVTTLVNSTMINESIVSSMNPTDSLIIARHKTKQILTDSEPLHDITEQSSLFNSTAINVEIKQELDSIHSENEDSLNDLKNLDITFEGISFGNRVDENNTISKDDTLKAAKKRVQFEQVDLDETTTSITKRTRKNKDTSSSITKNNLNETSDAKDVLNITEKSNKSNRSDTTLIEEIRCQCGLIEGTLNMSKLTLDNSENTKRSDKHTKSKSAKKDRVIVKSEPMSSDENSMAGNSTIVKESAKKSTRSMKKATKTTSKNNKSANDISNITLRGEVKKGKHHKLQIETHRAKVNVRDSQCDSSCSCWESDSSDCECYNCTLLFNASLDAIVNSDESFQISSAERKKVAAKGSRTRDKYNDYESDSSDGCCCRHACRIHHRGTHGRKKYYLRSMRK